MGRQTAQSMKVYGQEDADPRGLDGETVGILGYGIQGRAQALTLRDSRARVIVGNRADPYRDQARADGFEAFDLAEAARRASLIVVLLPDEIQPEVHQTAIAPGLSSGKGLVFAHGFSIHYRLIEPRPTSTSCSWLPECPGIT